MAGTRRGFGVAAAIAPVVIRAAASSSESYGYDSFWVNDTAQGDGLRALAEAAADTAIIKLGVGVIPLSRRSPESISAQVNDLARKIGQSGHVGDTIEMSGQLHTIHGVSLPLDRLLLGVGSGAGGPGALERVRQGVELLRAQLDTRIFISALGPRMSRLAGEVADGVLFNWLTPDYARRSAEWVREGAARAGRDVPQLYAYVRVALGPASTARLVEESARYGAIPSYADHFRRMAVEPAATGIGVKTPEEIRALLVPWEGAVDEVVIRAITAEDTLAETIDLIKAAAPL